MPIKATILSQCGGGERIFRAEFLKFADWDSFKNFLLTPKKAIKEVGVWILGFLNHEEGGFLTTFIFFKDFDADVDGKTGACVGGIS